MTVKLRLEFDNHTKPGFDSLARELDRLENKGDLAAKSMSGLNHEFNSNAIADCAKDIDRLAGGYSALIEKIQEGSRAQEQFGKSHKKGDSGGGWLEFAGSKAMAGLDAVNKLWEGASKAREAIHYMAEQGVTGFQKLDEAGNRAGQTLIDGFKNAKIEELGSTIAVGINTLAIPAIQGCTSLLSSLAGAATSTTDALAGMVGVNVPQMRAEQESAKVEESRRKALKEDEGRRAEHARQAAEFMQSVSERSIKNAEARRLAELTSIQDVERELTASRERLESRRQKMLTSERAEFEKQRKAAESEAATIERLESKRYELVQANKERERKALEQEAERKEQLHRKELDWNRQLAQAGIENERSKMRALEAQRTQEKANKDKQVQQMADFMQQGGLHGILAARGRGSAQMASGNNQHGGFTGPAGMVAASNRFRSNSPNPRAEWKQLRDQGGKLIQTIDQNPVSQALGQKISQKAIENAVLQKRQKEVRNQFIDEQRALGRIDQNGRALTEQQIAQLNTGPDLGPKPSQSFLDQKEGKGREPKEALDVRGKDGLPQSETIPKPPRKATETKQRQRAQEEASRKSVDKVMVDVQTKAEEPAGPVGSGAQGAGLSTANPAQASQNDARDQEQAQRKLDAMLKRRLAEVTSQFKSQKKREGIPMEEQAAAYSELMQSGVETLAASGKVSETMISTVRQTVDNQQRLIASNLSMAEEQKRLQQEIKAAQSMLRELSSAIGQTAQVPATTRKAQQK